MRQQQDDDVPAGFAFGGAHAFDPEADMQHVVDLDRQQKVPSPAERHAGQKAVFALRFLAVGDRQARQPVRDAAAEVRRIGKFLVNMDGGEVAGKFGVGVPRRGLAP